MLQLLLTRQQRDFNETCIGRTLPVLLEKRGRHEGQLAGRSPYLQSVHLAAPADRIGNGSCHADASKERTVSTRRHYLTTIEDDLL